MNKNCFQNTKLDYAQCILLAIQVLELQIQKIYYYVIMRAGTTVKIKENHTWREKECKLKFDTFEFGRL